MRRYRLVGHSTGYATNLILEQQISENFGHTRAADDEAEW